MADGNFNVLDVVETGVVYYLYRDSVDGDASWQEMCDEVKNLCWTKWLV